jgi:hypothetical protein
MSREDRQRRDKELAQKLGEASDRQYAAKRLAAEKEASVRPLRPGEPGKYYLKNVTGMLSKFRIRMFLIQGGLLELGSLR